MPRGRGRGGFGRGWFGRGFGWPGNPYPFCRQFPWLPRWWWAYPGYGLPYYGASWFPQYLGYAYPWYGYRPYR